MSSRTALCSVALMALLASALEATTLPRFSDGVVRCGVIDLNRVEPEKGAAYILPFFAAEGDGGGNGNHSPILLFEDTLALGPAHSVHDDIRATGKGRYSHWGNALYFSTSDNSDPRANGRVYSWAVPTGTACPVQMCGGIDMTRAHQDSGFAYIVDENFGFPGDSSGSSTSSSLQLYEGSRPLGPAHALHADIRSLGSGRFSHWGNSLRFSASDNSDPLTNGRPYSYGGKCRALRKVRFVRLATNAPFFATFGSHNQHVVENGNGIFVTHLRRMNAGPSFAGGKGNALDTHSDWEMLRSVDDGKTFTPVYLGTRETTHVAPIVDSDTAGMVYVFEQQFSSLAGADVHILRFSSASGFQTPSQMVLPGMASDKFSSVYDPIDNRFYYAATSYAPGHPAHIATVPVTGRITVSNPIVVEGSHGFLMYPLLAFDRGLLYLAWTSQELPKLNPYLYWDIHFMRSPDGGRTWTTMSGKVLPTPVLADGDGGADRVTLPDETGAHPWLASFLPRNGMVHFYYQTNEHILRTHYTRYNLAAGKFDVDIYPAFKGNSLQIKGMEGFFTAKAGDPHGLLYFIGQNSDHGAIVVLASDDEGRTWFDYAVGRQRFNSIYSISGERAIGGSGNIYGVFTALLSKDESANANEVWLLSVPAQ